MDRRSSVASLAEFFGAIAEFHGAEGLRVTAVPISQECGNFTAAGNHEYNSSSSAGMRRVGGLRNARRGKRTDIDQPHAISPSVAHAVGFRGTLAGHAAAAPVTQSVGTAFSVAAGSNGYLLLGNMSTRSDRDGFDIGVNLVGDAGQRKFPFGVEISNGLIEPVQDARHAHGAVAYNGQVYLSVWVQFVDGSLDPFARVVYGARVSSTGEVLDPTPIRIWPDASDTNKYPSIPDLSVGSDGAGFLVAGVALPTANALTGSYFSREITFSNSGAPILAPASLWAPSGQPGPLHIAFNGSNYDIVAESFPVLMAGTPGGGYSTLAPFTCPNSNGETGIEENALAYHAGELLLVFRVDGSNCLGTGIFASRLDTSWAPKGSPFKISDLSAVPEVAFNGTSYQVLITPTSGPSTALQVSATQDTFSAVTTTVATGAIACDGNGCLSANGVRLSQSGAPLDTTVASFSQQAAPEVLPQAAYGAQQYLVAWQGHGRRDRGVVVRGARECGRVAVRRSTHPRHGATWGQSRASCLRWQPFSRFVAAVQLRGEQRQCAMGHARVG